MAKKKILKTYLICNKLFAPSIFLHAVDCDECQE
jgi:hypothetical protein